MELSKYNVNNNNKIRSIKWPSECNLGKPKITEHYG